MMRRAKSATVHWVRSWGQIGLSWLGGFLGVAAVGYLNQWLTGRGIDQFFLIAPFGATAVLLYGAPSVPYSQPRNVLGGQVLSALVGVAMYQAVSGPLWLASAVTLASAHGSDAADPHHAPPGGATALIALLGDERVHALGFGMRWCRRRRVSR